MKAIVAVKRVVDYNVKVRPKIRQLRCFAVFGATFVSWAVAVGVRRLFLLRGVA